ncbi:MAG: ABC transporter permease subunit [Candidatus Krumholzibacteriia bacterium]
MAAPDPGRAVRGRGPIGARGGVFLLLAGAGAWAAWALRLDPRALWPGPDGWQLAGEFFGRAWRPALTHQAADLPPATPALLVLAGRAAVKTVVFAAAAMPPSILLGLGLGMGASTSWWSSDRDRGGARRWRPARLAGPVVSSACRLVAAALRSVHELLWAVLLLAAFGLTPLAAVVALALPYGGTLAKVFGEMLDEAPRDAAEALGAAGATGAQVFLWGRLPRAFGDLLAYTLYRFECALRTAAVLGFFGLPTLGYHLAASFENLYYGEVWTYLYTLLGLVLAVDWWSGAVRRRLVA